MQFAQCGDAVTAIVVLAIPVVIPVVMPIVTIVTIVAATTATIIITAAAISIRILPTAPQTLCLLPAAVGAGQAGAEDSQPARAVRGEACDCAAVPAHARACRARAHHQDAIGADAAAFCSLERISK